MFFCGDTTMRIMAPIIPKEFFHTAGNFGEHHKEAQKVGFPHPVLPWITFFKNVDAIIGPDEPIVYPKHLTVELDYELSCCCAEEIRKAFSCDYSLYSQAPTRLATMTSTRPTPAPTTNRRFGNNPNGIWPRIGSAYPTTQ
jgi:hypothetical protein